MKFPGYCVGLHGVTAMDSAVLLQGRPKGGVLLIYYPDSINGNAKPIKNLFDRLCALSCQVDCISLYLFCVYMSCDCNKSENWNEFDKKISEILSLCI